jgi:hypothetical protein
MPSTSSRLALFPTLVLAGAWLSATAPLAAMAADDGQAPIWTGLYSMLGLSDSKKEEMPIEYRERSKLVLPPKMVLPPPAAAPVTDVSAWPVDPDVQRVNKANEDKRRHTFTRKSARLSAMEEFSPDAPVTVRADAGVGPATKPCVTGSPIKDCQSPGWSIFSPLGFGGANDVSSLGPEPDRDWLTDPPKGYRAPVAAPSVK